VQEDDGGWVPKVGDTVAGKYRIEGLIGAGGTSRVFAAQHLLTGKRFALKVLRPDARAPDVTARFLREAQAAGRIQHPNVVDVYDVGSERDTFYIVMELLEGEPLAAAIARGDMALRDALEWILQAMHGVQSAHAVGVIHRDLKPANIYLCGAHSGRMAKVLDFGIAKLSTREELTTTSAGTVMGSPFYMSPEQLQESRSVDERTDIYAFGVILYEALCGRVPFVADSYPALVLKIVTDKPANPRTLRPELPAGLEHVVLKALARDQNNRYRSLSDLIEALLPYLPATDALPLNRYLPGPNAHRAPIDAAARDAQHLNRWTSTGSAQLAQSDHTTASQMRPEAAEPAPTSSHTVTRRAIARGALVTSALVVLSLAASLAAVKSAPALLGGSLLLTGVVYVSLAIALAAAAARFARLRIASRHRPERTARRPSATVATQASQQQAIIAAAPSSLLGHLPEEMQPLVSAIEAFVDALFASYTPVSVGVLELQGLRIPNAGDCAHYIIFMAATAQRLDKAIHTQTFMAYAGSLEDHLRQLDRRRKKVIIAVTDSHELGRGVREKVFDYQRDYEAMVVPLYTREIASAHRSGQLQALFDDRFGEYHVSANLFESGRPFDPTRFIGMRNELKDLTLCLRTPAAFANVYGLPGSGKSSLVKLAEYGIETLSFAYVRCSTVNNDTTQLANNLVDALIGPPSDGSQKLSMSDAFDRLGTGLSARPDDLVLVLEDADWVLEALERGEPELARAAREFWTRLAAVTQRHALRAIAISVQGFILRTNKLRGWENPLANRVTVIRISPLGAASLERLVTTIGAEMNVSFEPAASRRLFEMSGGHIHTLQRICSTIVEQHRSRTDHHPLSAIIVGSRDVDRAVEALAVDESVYRERILAWLDETEQAVLQVLASGNVRSRRMVQAKCEHPPERVTDALRRLRAIGLIKHDSSREVHTIPLLARWMTRNVDRPSAAPDRARQRRARVLTAGVSLSLMMLSLYATMSNRDCSTEPVRYQGCSYAIRHPSRVVRGQPFMVSVMRSGCGPTASPVPLALVGGRNTSIEGDTKGEHEVPLRMQATCSTLNCEGSAAIAIVFAVSWDFELVLKSKADDIGKAAIGTDALASLHAEASSVLKVASIFPALFALFWAFHGQVREALLPFFGVLKRGRNEGEG
jgi:serine/threonine protein kinase